MGDPGQVTAAPSPTVVTDVAPQDRQWRREHVEQLEGNTLGTGWMFWV